MIIISFLQTWKLWQLMKVVTIMFVRLEARDLRHVKFHLMVELMEVRWEQVVRLSVFQVIMHVVMHFRINVSVEKFRVSEI